MSEVSADGDALAGDMSRMARWTRRLATGVALAGGVVLIAVVALVTLSVAGRTLIPLGLSSIRGDYELVEAGVAFAVFCFLPYAHLVRAHATVTLLTDRFGPRANVLILMISDLLMLLLAVFLLWRHSLGTLDKFSYSETTLFLRMPLWWAYAAGLPGALAFVLVAAYVFWNSARGFSAAMWRPVA